MPFFRCHLPKFDSPKPPFRFDNNSWPTYLRNSIISNEEKQENDDCLNDEEKSKNKSQKIQIVDRPHQNHWQKLVLNQRCPFFRFHENLTKIKIDQRGSDRKSDENQTKHQFDFDSLNIRLLETFGFIGTALVVGFDIRSRINQWSPAQHRRDHRMLEHISNDNRERLPNFVENGYPLNDFCRTKTIYCGSNRWCNYILGKIFAMPSFLPSLSSNIVDQTPSTIKINDDDVHGRTDSLVASGVTKTNKKVRNIEELERILCLQPEQNYHTTNCSLFLYNNNENRKSIEKDKDDICITNIVQKNEYPGHLNTDLSLNNYLNCEKASGTVDVSEYNQDDHHSSDDDYDDDSTATASNNNGDFIASVFRQTCLEYSDILNNLSGIQLMKKQRPNDALSCWLSCDTRYSAALFNLGVAYESGLYAMNDDGKPDMDMAFHYYTLAASKGHYNAIYNIALYYLYGKGSIKTNIDHALKLLRIASSKGVQQARDYCQRFDDEKEKLHNQRLINNNKSKSNPSLSSPSYDRFDSDESSLFRSNASNIIIRRSTTLPEFVHYPDQSISIN